MFWFKLLKYFSKVLYIANYSNYLFFTDKPTKCRYRGEEYDVGKPFKPDPINVPCYTCECTPNLNSNGQLDVFCRTETCVALNCKEDTQEVRLDGDCCPTSCERKY